MNTLITISTMVRKICIGMFLLACVGTTRAQQTFEKTFGSTGFEEATSVSQTPDGGYIIGGTHLIKVDSQGVESWSKSLPSTYVSLTSDKGYILVDNPSDIAFTKVDSLGNVLWRTGFRDGIWANQGNAIAQIEGDGYIVTGRFQDVTGSGMLLLKLDAQGNKVFRGSYSEPTSAGFCTGLSVIQTADKGFIMTGFAHIDYYDSTRHTDVFVVKIDSSGVEEWRKLFGGTANEVGTAVRQDDNGNYFISGTTHSFGTGTGSNMYLVKLDTAGNTLWEKTYGGSLSETASGLWITQDGGCMLTGSTNSFSAAADWDGYMVKTDADGDTLWTNMYKGAGEERLYAVQQSSDLGYVMAGKTNSIGAGDFDMLLLKTDTKGNIGLATSIYGQETPLFKHTISPNPSQGIFAIQSEARISFIEVFDLMGNQLYTEIIHDLHARLDLRQQPQGMYLYHLYLENEARPLTGKIIRR